MQAIRWIDQIDDLNQQLVPPRYIVVTPTTNPKPLANDCSDKAIAESFVNNSKYAPALLFAFELHESILSQIIDADPTLRKICKSTIREAVKANDSKKLKAAWDAADAIVTCGIENNEYSEFEYRAIAKEFVVRVKDILCENSPINDSIVQQTKTLLNDCLPNLTPQLIAQYINYTPQSISNFALNSDVVTIRLVFAKYQLSQSLVIILSAVIGAVIAIFLGLVNKIKTSLKIRELNSQLKAANGKIDELNKLISKNSPAAEPKPAADQQNPAEVKKEG